MNIEKQAVEILAEKGGTIVWSTDAALNITSLRGQDDLIARLGAMHRRALSGESLALDLDAAGHTYSVRIDPLRDERGAIVGCVGVAQDVTAQYVDSVTGLPNRRQVHEHLSRFVSRAEVIGNDLAVLLVDLDSFRIVNAAVGQAAGDALLIATARRLATVTESHFLSRTGDNEFTIVAARAEVDELAAEILGAFQTPFHVGGRDVHVTVSLGVAMLGRDGDTVDVLLRAASAALRRAKELGGNGYQLASSALTHADLERLQIERRLRRAITEGELSLVYQPQVRLSDRSITCLEALLRWNRDGKLFAAADFIRAVEPGPVIVALGEWVIDETCRQIAEWRRSGLQVPRIALNIGARHFQQPHLVSTIRRALAHHGIEGSAIELEITETAAMEDAEVTVRAIDALRELGLAITIDDFGTGYSSLAYLKRFAITGMKIDRSFVSDVPESRTACAIVKAILATAHALDLRVVAEGVETREQAAFLAATNCDEAQGHLFSKPVNAKDVPNFLRAKEFIDVA